MAKLLRNNDHSDNEIPVPAKDARSYTDNSKSGPWSPPCLADWMLESEQSRRWMVDKFIPYEALILCSGHQKRAFKTWLADFLVILTATGTDYGAFKVDGPGKVLYIEEEGQQAETKNRLTGICNATGINPRDLTNIDYSFHQRVKLNEPEWKAKLEAYMIRERPRLVVLDALVYLHNCDENKTNEMLGVFDTIMMMRHHGASVLMIAHLNGKGEDKHVDIDAQVRGSGLIVNAYDIHLALRRYLMKDPEIDLTVRARGSPERPYKVKWEIRNDDGDVVVWAAPEILGIDDKVVMEADAKKCLRQMMVLKEYTPTALFRLWRLPKREAELLMAVLFERGELVQKGKKYVRVVVPESKGVIE